LNGLSIKSNPVTSKIIFTDASAHSYGGFVCQRLSKQICRGSFSKFENNLSSTARELLAVKYVIESFLSIFYQNNVFKLTSTVLTLQEFYQ